MSESQITNGQRAARALDGINAHTWSSEQPERGMSEERFFFDFDRDTEPGTDHTRLADLLRDLHHYADRRGLNFDDALATARRGYEGQLTTYQPGDAIRLAGRSSDAAAENGFPLVGEIIKARPGLPAEYQVEFLTQRQWISEPGLKPAPRFPGATTRFGRVSSAHAARWCFSQTVGQVGEAVSRGSSPEAEDIRDLAGLLDALSRWSSIAPPALLRVFSEVIGEKNGRLVAQAPGRNPVTLATLDAPGPLGMRLRAGAQAPASLSTGNPLRPPAAGRSVNRNLR
jgi:hypothetical protein